jgi:hypothetical protein
LLADAVHDSKFAAASAQLGFASAGAVDAVRLKKIKYFLFILIPVLFPKYDARLI